MGERGVGTVLGAGAAVGLLFLMRKAFASESYGSPRERVPGYPLSPSGSGSPRERSFGPTGKFDSLVERWRPEVARRAGDLPVDALLTWIQIESGGDMSSGEKGREVGIWQLFFPDDARYGATLEGLRAISARSKEQNPADLSWLTDADLDMEVGAGIRKVLAARDTVRHVFAQNGVTWPESSSDFGAAVKQIHATPAVITELVPKITHRDGAAPSSWADLRSKVMAFPVAQMGAGLQSLVHRPSERGLKNRLEDTLRNAEIFGHAWGAAA